MHLFIGFSVAGLVPYPLQLAILWMLVQAGWHYLGAAAVAFTVQVAINFCLVCRVFNCFDRFWYRAKLYGLLQGSMFGCKFLGLYVGVEYFTLSYMLVAVVLSGAFGIVAFLVTRRIFPTSAGLRS